MFAISSRFDKLLKKKGGAKKGKKFRDKSRESVINLNKIVQSKIDKEKLDVFFEVISQMNDILDCTQSLTETNEKARK